MEYHIILVVVSSAILITLGYVGLRNLSRAQRRLSDEQTCVDELAVARRSMTEKEFADNLAVRARADLLAGKYAKEIFWVVAAGSHIDQASIRERATRDLEDRPLIARSVASMAVYGGLLGTLLGLATAVLKLNSIPPIQTPKDIQAFGEATRGMFGSFGWAFAAAATGILITLYLGYLVAKYDTQASKLASNIETLCVEVIMPAARALSKPQTATSLNELLAGMIADYQELSQSNFGRFEALGSDLAALTASLSTATLEIRGTADLLLQSVTAMKSTSGAVGKATDGAAKAAEEVRGAALEVASAAGSLRVAAETWDGTAIREANSNMARIVPDLSAEVARIFKVQGDEVVKATQQVEATVARLESMLVGQAGLIAQLDEQLRDAAALSLQSPPQVAASLGSASVHSNSDVVNLLRDIKAAVIANRPLPQTIPTSDGEVIIQPIPPEVLRSLEEMQRSLVAIERVLVLEHSRKSASGQGLGFREWIMRFFRKVT